MSYCLSDQHLQPQNFTATLGQHFDEGVKTLYGIWNWLNLDVLLSESKRWRSHKNETIGRQYTSMDSSAGVGKACSFTLSGECLICASQLMKFIIPWQINSDGICICIPHKEAHHVSQLVEWYIIMVTVSVCVYVCVRREYACSVSLWWYR